jgi:hypothetical protein
MKRWIVALAVLSGTALAGYKKVEQQVWTPDYCWRVVDHFGYTTCCEPQPGEYGIDPGIDPNFGGYQMHCKTQNHPGEFYNSGFGQVLGFRAIELPDVPRLECMRSDGGFGKCNSR